MNQELELHAFIDWLEINPLEPTAQTLWLHLMVIANKSGCPEWFTVTNPLLQAKVGVTENTLNKHRNYLVQKGRIEYKSMGKQKAGKYKIISFNTSNFEVKDVVKGEANREVKGEAKGTALLKDLSSSESSSSKPQPNNYESYYAAHKRVFGFGCNPWQSQKLGVYIDQDGLDEEVVIRAIERAALKMEGYNFNLISTILDDYFHAGARTLEQAMAIDALFDARKKSSQQQRGNERKVVDFNEIARELKHAEG